MISATYAISGLLLVGCGCLFERDLLTAETQTLAWMVVFFFASAAASAAYLTVSETFPIEIRALTIAIFYAIGTALGGVAAPFVFGKLIESGSRQSIFGGYVFAADPHVGGRDRRRALCRRRGTQAARAGRDAALGRGLGDAL